MADSDIMAHIIALKLRHNKLQCMNHLVRLHDRQIWLDGMLNQRVDLAMQRFVSRLFGGGLFGATNTFAPALLN